METRVIITGNYEFTVWLTQIIIAKARSDLKYTNY